MYQYIITGITDKAETRCYLNKALNNDKTLPSLFLQHRVGKHGRAGTITRIKTFGFNT